MDNKPAAKPWPSFKDYPQTEAGYNEYQNAWVGRRRMAPLISMIPMEAIEDHRAALALAATKGWQEIEEG